LKLLLLLSFGTVAAGLFSIENAFQPRIHNFEDSCRWRIVPDPSVISWEHRSFLKSSNIGFWDVSTPNRPSSSPLIINTGIVTFVFTVGKGTIFPESRPRLAGGIDDFSDGLFPENGFSVTLELDT
jgi:hypothetical protein